MGNIKPIPSRAKAQRAPGTGLLVLGKQAARSKAGNLAVAITPEMLKTLSPMEAAVKAIVETLGKGIASSRKSGRSGGFAVVIDREGNPEITPLPQMDVATNPLSDEEEREQAFARARERGRIRAADILSGDDMLSADAMAERLGVSRVTVNARRQRHELLGLDAAKRGFRFPDWQVDDDGNAIEVLPRLFELLGPSPWGVYRFLTQRHDVLNGATAKDALLRGQAEKVLDAAESLARGDFA
ncbi:MAG: hypothetical protein JHD35_10730 [Sphingopyxis sp.]|nr:hypothetical protein [Sphingopyxis sp.]